MLCLNCVIQIIVLLHLLIYTHSTNCAHLSSSRLDNNLEGERRSKIYFGRLNDIYSDEGQIVEVKFLTKVRSKRDLSSNDYHIIQLKLPSQETHISIHLHKNPNLSVSSELVVNENSEDLKLEEEVEGLSDCFYTGEVSEHPEGRAALSSCDEDEGFTGHILIGDEHFVIEPLGISDFNESSEIEEVFERIDKREIEGKPTILHRIFQADDIMKKENSTHSDALRVPKEELEKAVAEMANVTATEDNDEEDSIKTDTKPKLKSTISLGLDEESTFLTETFAAKSKNKKKKSQKAKKSNQMTVSGPKIVEVAVFSDAKLLKVWESRFAKNPKAKLRVFILNIINSVNLLYQQPSLGIAVTFRLVYLEMMSTIPKGLDVSGGDGQKYLTSFCSYAGNMDDRGNKWDHALLLTGMDLKDERNDYSLAGMAWLGTMCLRYWSCSISEGTSFASVFTLAHEIGHGLGMEHDGEGPSLLCNKEKYLMSPTTGPGKITWSTCSSQNLKDFITKGSRELLNSEHGNLPYCLTKPSLLKNKRIKFAGKLPGAVYGIKAQCQYDCGNSCVPSTTNNNICSILLCDAPGTSKQYQTVKYTHPALEGSPCGTGKHCRYGKCVSKPNSNVKAG